MHGAHAAPNDRQHMLTPNDRQRCTHNEPVHHGEVALHKGGQAAQSRAATASARRCQVSDMLQSAATGRDAGRLATYVLLCHEAVDILLPTLAGPEAQVQGLAERGQARQVALRGAREGGKGSGHEARLLGPSARRQAWPQRILRIMMPVTGSGRAWRAGAAPAAPHREGAVARVGDVVIHAVVLANRVDVPHDGAVCRNGGRGRRALGGGERGRAADGGVMCSQHGASGAVAAAATLTGGGDEGDRGVGVHQHALHHLVGLQRGAGWGRMEQAEAGEPGLSTEPAGGVGDRSVVSPSALQPQPHQTRP